MDEPFVGRAEKIKIIDTMIDGLQRLKTLVIEEEKTKKLPQIKKQSSIAHNTDNSTVESSQNSRNFGSKDKHIKFDKTMLEISKILETEKEYDTPSNDKNPSKFYRRQEENKPDGKGSQTNLFKSGGAKRGKELLILETLRTVS